MIKKSVLLFCCLCLSIIGITQKFNLSVISSAGDVNKTDKMYLEWTLGEPFIESVSSNKQLYTQGFHQPLKIFNNKFTILTLPPEAYDITILPNPVQTVLQAVIKRETASKLYLELSDINGRALLIKTCIAKNEIIPFNLSSFSSGVYTLSVRNTNGTLYKTFKILKAYNSLHQNN